MEALRLKDRSRGGFGEEGRGGRGRLAVCDVNGKASKACGPRTEKKSHGLGIESDFHFGPYGVLEFAEFERLGKYYITGRR